MPNRVFNTLTSTKKRAPKQKKLRLRWKGGDQDVILPREKALAKLIELASEDEKVLVTQYPLYV